MILGEKITLLRKKNGWSQEELAEKMGVSRQAISKWESAQSVPDLNRVLALSEIFCISTDVLLKDDAGENELFAFGEEPGLPAVKDPYAGMETIPLRRVSLEEANNYLEKKIISSGRIAIGVMMCILSPVVLVLMSGAWEEGFLSLTENQAAGIGILVLMLMVGAAVGLFVHTGMMMSKYEYMEKEALETEYGVEGMVRERKERFAETYTRYMILGILLCVLSCVPIFIAMIMGGSDMSVIIGVCVLLVMVAVGVMLIVRNSIVMGAMKSLLEEGDYSRENKRDNRRNESVMGIYWLAATAIYLAVSFLTGRWDISWIVWPIAGIGCGILAAVLKMIRKRE